VERKVEDTVEHKLEHKVKPTVEPTVEHKVEPTVEHEVDPLMEPRVENSTSDSMTHIANPAHAPHLRVIIHVFMRRVVSRSLCHILFNHFYHWVTQTNQISRCCGGQ